MTKRKSKQIHQSSQVKSNQGLGILWQLEPRMMFDGAAVSASIDVVEQTLFDSMNQQTSQNNSADHSTLSNLTPADTRILDAEADHQETPIIQLENELEKRLANYEPPARPANEIIFADTRVENYETLLAGIDPNIPIVLLDSQKDGVKQMADYLTQHQSVEAIHIISHGGSGSLQLGTGSLTLNSMTQQYTAEMAVIKQALSEQADILIYGCDFAEGQAGQDAATLLSQLTGADVAASIDDTGYAGLGGDWNLELKTGIIETPLVISYDIQADWIGILSLTANGGETRINTTTTDTQTHNSVGNSYTPDSVAMDANGNFVSVWESAGNIYGQRYTSAGTAQGGEFVVASQAATERLTSVSMNSSGAFVVTWERDQGTGDHDIYARLYNASGTAVASEFLVNETLTYDQQHARVAMAADGSFVVVFESNTEASGTSAYNVYAQHYDATGTKIGSNVLVNTTTAGYQGNADIAMDSTGNFVIVWDGERSAGSNTFSVYGQQYGSSGVAQGGELLVNTIASGTDHYASVAMNNSGNFVVTWVRHSGGDTDVQAQRFNSAGVAQGSAISVTNTTLYNQEISNVAMDQNGNFVVSWSSDLQDGSGWGVYTRQYDPTGTALTTESQVATTTTNIQDYSGIAYQNGKVVVTWSGNGTGDSTGIFMQRYDAAGLNAVPTITSNGGDVTATISIAENTTAVTTVTATDADVGATLTYSISGGADAAKFTINSSTGALSFVTAPNYESPTDSGGNNVYDVMVTVSDNNGGTDSQSIAVTVTAVNEVPTDLSLSANTVAESATNGTAVGTVNGTDPDSGDTKTYSLTDNAGGRFAINSSTGQITVADGTLLDYESATNHSVTVRVTDSGGLTYDETFTINVTNVNEAPAGADAIVTINEGTFHTTTTANFGFSDVDAGDSLSAVRIDTLPGAGSLTLSGVAVTAGQIVSVADITAGNLVFTPVAGANGAGYASFTFSVRDSNNTYDAAPNTLTINVTAINDAPTDLALSGNSVAENAANGTLVGTASATDPDSGDTQSYSLTDTAGGRFAINSSTGEITVANGSLLNYEAAASHSVTVRITDSGGLTYDETFTINVTNVNEAPINIVPGSQTINRNAPLTLGGISVSDANNDLSTVQLVVGHGTLKVTLSGTASISAGSNGTNSLTLSGSLTDINATLASLIYQSNYNYIGIDTLNVTSSDSNLAQDVDTVAINVVYNNNLPVGLNDSYTLLQDSIFSVEAPGLLINDSDADGDKLSITPVSSPENGTLVLSSDGSFIYTPNKGFVGVDSFTYVVHDGYGNSSPVTVMLTVNPVVLPLPETPLSPITTITSPSTLPAPAPATGLPLPAAQGAMPSIVSTIVLPAIQNLLEPTIPSPSGEATKNARLGLQPTKLLQEDASSNLPEHLQEISSPISRALLTQNTVFAHQQLWKEVENIQIDIQKAFDEKELTSNVASVAGISLAAGIVGWLTRSGSMLASFLSIIPAWKSVDPLSIVVAKSGKNTHESLGDDDDIKQKENSAEKLFYPDK